HNFAAGKDIRGSSYGGIGFLQKIAGPTAEVVHPGQDGVEAGCEGCNSEPALPAIVFDQTHGRFAPRGFAGLFIKENGGDQVVTFGVNIGLNDYVFPDDALNRESAAVNLRLDRFNGDATKVRGREGSVIFRHLQTSLQRRKTSGSSGGTQRPSNYTHGPRLAAASNSRRARRLRVGLANQANRAGNAGIGARSGIFRICFRESRILRRVLPFTGCEKQIRLDAVLLRVQIKIAAGGSVERFVGAAFN